MTSETQTAFAKRRGVSRKSVREWKDRGWIVMASGKVDVEQSEAALATRPEFYMGGRTSQPRKSAPQPKPTHFASADWSLAEAARRREIAIALKRQLDYDVAAGKLVDAAAVTAIMRSDYSVTAQRLLQVPSRVAPRVAAMQSAAEIEALLHREFVKSLNTLSEAAGEELRNLEAKNA